MSFLLFSTSRAQKRPRAMFRHMTRQVAMSTGSGNGLTGLKVVWKQMEATGDLLEQIACHFWYYHQTNEGFVDFSQHKKYQHF